ncbi:class I SAM-dependent methyltransferase [Caldimonas brevitalea]|uniref:tRNA (Cmo5U34)-methyltransferase n=1 Tax=Caldimonas brevitalea TaxID=413882 RepID=A0A0G3BTK9_9BURK|nr:class I SAM-dependent methyltransferase [Caldimonas brevitalea]AKJ30731.1 tRNA (cmo5U34)-methyltransferase [Caldimonas brevitalea]
MPETQTKRFDREEARRYDTSIRALVPGYDVLHLLSAARLSCRLSAQADLLIVGAGSGEEIVRLAPAHPEWRFVGTDLSTEMLQRASERLSSAGVLQRVRLHHGELTSLPATQHDATLLLLVLHFLPDTGDKLALLTDIAHRLKPGGVLLLADLMGPEDAWERPAHAAASRTLGLPATAADQLPEQLARKFHCIDRTRRDALLGQAGFAAPVPYFRALGFEAVAAVRR